jgi:hypothetical protein
MKAAVVRRRARGALEVSAGTFLIVMCAALVVVSLTSRSAAAD